MSSAAAPSVPPPPSTTPSTTPPTPQKVSLDGIGTTNVWGFSRALDLQKDSHYLSETPLQELKDPADIYKQNYANELPPLNILTLGAGDMRHIFKTVAQAWRHGKRQINFYVMETQATVLARNMLLLSILFENDLDLGLQDRVELFLDIYGNLQVTEKTANFIKSRAQQLIRTVTDSQGPLANILDFRYLRFREKDDLEFVFKFWMADPSKKAFDIKKLLEFRQRKLYGMRYDHRENVVDWDYHMKLKPYAPIVHKKEYQRFREHGLTYEFRSQEYTCPNRTLATVDGLKDDGLTVNKWGYFSDIILGTFTAFGTDTEQKEFLKLGNGVYSKSSQDLAEYNVLALLTELMTGTYYSETPTLASTEKDQPKWNVLENVKIHFLPCDPQPFLVPTTSKFKAFTNMFDVVYLASGMAHRIADVGNVLKEGGKVVVESARYMLDLTADQIHLYSSKILSLSNSLKTKFMLRYTFLESEELVFDMEHFVFVRVGDGEQVLLGKEGVYRDWNGYFKELEEKKTKKGKVKGKGKKREEVVGEEVVLQKDGKVDSKIELLPDDYDEGKEEGKVTVPEISITEVDDDASSEMITNIPDIRVTPATPRPLSRSSEYETDTGCKEVDDVCERLEGVEIPDIMVTPATPRPGSRLEEVGDV